MSNEISVIESNKDISSCGVYLAESSIKNAGFGVFAGRNFSIGERIGEGGLGIQVIDIEYEKLRKELISDFGWNPLSVGGDGEAMNVLTALTGIAMLINFHPLLSNVLAGGLQEETLFDRRYDANAGAITSYHNFTFLAKNHIQAGQEIFANVADKWFMDRKTDDEDIIPQIVEYELGDNLVKDLAEYKKKYPDISDSIFLDILLRMKKDILQNFETMERLIPDTIEGVLDAAERGIAKTLLNEHSLEWIEKNGKCLDNLRPGISTIPGAGRGAFATRFIPKGTLVAPCPLVHVIDKATLLMNENITRYQLLLNYCFGHRKSTLLLCPTTSVSLINHSKEQKNAMYKWAASSKNQKRNINFIMKPMDDLESHPTSLSERNSKLMFDFIATRDILEGEEVFIDYGNEWENAWNEHVENWKMSDSAETYVSASVLNAKQTIIEPEDNDASTTRHHSFLCELEPFARDEDPEYEGDLPVEDYHANPSLNKDNWDERTKTMYLDNNFIWWWPCIIESTNKNNSLFTVRILQRTPSKASNRPTIRKLKNFPRKSIKFTDKPYHSDQHLSNAFRYYIPIPDEIFPLHWRNDYVSAKQLELGAKDFGNSNDNQVNEIYLQNLREAKCGIYMAPSTIPNAGKGIYLGMGMPKEGIDLGARIPILPITDFTASGWDAFDYTWTSGSYIAEFEADKVQVLTNNEGCLSNFHPGLVNMAMNDVTYMPILDRRKDPGAGAFSDYWNFSFRSRYKLKAGQEVFISYGESWFDLRDYLGKVPLSSNYDEANEIIATMIALSSLSEPSINDEQVSTLLNLIKDHALLDSRTKKIFDSLDTLGDLLEVSTKNGAAESTSEIRSLKWLEENGLCLDHIYVKESTIPQAGRGAFARRAILQGETIIPSPMLNSWGRDIFNIDTERSNKKQLIYNYMWAHPASNLLLYPTTTAIAINHASSRGKNHFRPNAELRWSQTDKKSMYYQQSHLEDLKKEHYATMVLDFVATRDIMPDEEILVDYGEEWENAWDSHVKNFRSPCSNPNHPCLNSSMAVYLMNEVKFNPNYYEWGHSYFSVCSANSKPTGLESIITLIPKNDEPMIKDLFNSDFSATYNYKYSYHGIKYDHHGFDLAANVDSWYPCMILNADEQERTFDVVYFTYEEPPEYPNGSILRREHSLNPDEIRFINKPYMSDMQWSEAFRHEMKIPDHIFPPLWKDLIE